MGDAKGPIRGGPYRTQETVLGSVAGAIAFIVLGVWAAVAPRNQWILAGGALLAGCQAWRAAVMGFYVSADGVRLKGFARTRAFKWREIGGFVSEPFGRYPCATVVLLMDGRKFSSVGVVSSDRRAESRTPNARSLADLMNRFLEENRS